MASGRERVRRMPPDGTATSFVSATPPALDTQIEWPSHVMPPMELPGRFHRNAAPPVTVKVAGSNDVRLYDPSSSPRPITQKCEPSQVMPYALPKGAANERISVTW